MIKAYLAGISTTYEGEDIQVQYGVLRDGTLIFKKSLMLDYRKPAVVGQVALQTLLNELKEYAAEEIIVYVNDSALIEITQGTTTTQNRDVLKMAVLTRKRLSRFENLVIKDVSRDHDTLMEWKEMLTFSK